MHSPKESTRILRTAAWIWIGFLLAMVVMDFVLYTQMNLPLIVQNPPLQQIVPGQQLPPMQPILPRNPLRPVYLFYGANGLVAILFLIFDH